MEATTDDREPQARFIDLDALADAVEAAFAEADPQVDEAKLAKMMEQACKMLHLAQTGATPGEREAAAGRAAAVMAKYGITAAMLADSGATAEVVADWLCEVGAPYCYDKVGLLAVVVDAYRGKAVYTAKSTHHSELRVYAMQKDMDRIQLLWESLLQQMDVELRWASARKPAGVRMDVFARSFILTFASTVGQRLKLAEQRAAAEAQTARDEAGTEGKSVALVLADRRTQVERAFKQAHPSTSKGRARKTRLSTAGANAGRTAGERANLGHRSVTG